MTHGEEPGPETHQDSAVLTYLEGLLMHPVATGPGATATRRSEAGHSNEEQGNKVDKGLQLPNHASSPTEKSSPPGAVSQHLKKARLLRSGTWSEPESQKTSAPTADVNGQERENHRASLDGPAQGESTLLASLLQSFSSRLQSVAMSQHVSQNHKAPDSQNRECSPANKDNTFQCYGTASSRLKGLMRKNKLQSNSNSVPYSRRSSQDRRTESPRSSLNSSQPAAPDSVSCAERLKAVANLVKMRSSPAPSPKPSVACSQLALLLSSEAHLQQYSREQALKAQLSVRSASERLAAMATQQTQDKRPPSMGETPVASDMLSSLNTSNGTLPQPTLNSSKRSPSLTPGYSTASPHSTPHPPKEKRPFDKHGGRPPQNCSTLLLLLLNNHNSQKQLTKNGHLDDDCGILPSHAPSLHSDSEYSNQENSLTKDSSDAESCYSSCSPIDLSVRSRVSSQKPEPSSSSAATSLDKLTESLINKWKPETPGQKVLEARELDVSPDMKSHQKVTLMQLLLDRRNNEEVNKTADNPDLHPDATPSRMSASPLKPTGSFEECGTPDRLMGGGLPTFSLGGDKSSTPSPYSYSSSYVQSSPLDLCKSKPYPSEKVSEPAFIASKLLQNLAKSGLQSPSPSPPLTAHRPHSKGQSPELDLIKHQAPMDRLVSPVKRNKTPVLEGPPTTFTPFGRELSPPASSQIENLLERRTVLQLLLGTASHKEKSCERRNSETTRACFEKPPEGSVICDSSNGPSLDIKIKTEPKEESLLSDIPDAGTRPGKWGGHKRHSPLGETQDCVKSEPCTTEAAAKCGLLSQLLKQQTTTYQTSTRTEPHTSTVKAEQQDYQVPLPKKRRLCMELAEHLSNELCQRPADTLSERLVSGTSGEHESRRLISPKEEDSLIRGPADKVHPRDSQGFNVLKQLLLSDNCLKELSQPRSSLSPQAPNCKANGNFFNRSSYNHELANVPWHSPSLMASHGNLKSLSNPSAVNSSQGSPWAKSSPKPSPTPIKKEPDSSPCWTLSGEEKCDSSPDSPRLTRSNPILYYMLQRGNGQLRKEMANQGLLAHSGVTVKEELGAEARDYEHRLSAVQRSPAHSEKHSNSGDHFNGSLTKW
ncbi:nuclear receptor-interacting protein 1 [Chanos chanos]|uniref:Nuclear receptor-interacting protein 1 n=1 Tax=Chanos chanos TaxID=29144 RepID=A0A6J2WVK9_CHACN|nr:nuclear receptor-interacting protein 1-like [Chanos chanos]